MIILSRIEPSKDMPSTVADEVLPSLGKISVRERPSVFSSESVSAVRGRCDSIYRSRCEIQFGLDRVQRVTLRLAKNYQRGGFQLRYRGAFPPYREVEPSPWQWCHIRKWTQIATVADDFELIGPWISHFFWTKRLGRATLM